MLILSIICFRILSNALLVCFYKFMCLGETELKKDKNQHPPIPHVPRAHPNLRSLCPDKVFYLN